jgi:hypothetical protein
MEARLAAAVAALSVATVAAAFAPASCMLRPTVHGSRPWASLRAHSARRMMSAEVPARRVLPRALAKPLHRDMGFGPCPCGLELRSTLDCANALHFRDATSPQMAPGQCFRRGLVRAALSLMLVLGVGLVRPAAGHAANANKGDITESWVCIANGESNNAAPSSLAMRAGNHLAFASADRNPGYVQRSDQPGVTAGKARPAFVATHDWKGLNHALSGQHKVVARDHIVMANWGDKSGPMLRQMESAVMVKIFLLLPIEPC